MNKKALASLLVTFALIFVYYQLWNRYAINIPKFDDHALKNTILTMEKAPTLGAKVYELYRQHNEHRIALTRLVAWIDYKIFGQINYEHLMLIGNLALLLIWWLLTRFFKPLRGAVWYALPIATFWFTLAFWENALWGMAAIQNFWVVAWAVLTFWKLSRVDKYWWWALPMAFAGVFTSGNGLFILPIGLFVLLLQRRWKIVIIWSVFSVLLGWLYFADYQAPPTDLTAKSTGIQTFVRSYLLFCGSLGEGLPFGNMPFQMPLWLGALSVFVSFCIVLYLLRSYWKRQFELDIFDYFYLGGIIFALSTALLVVYSRLGIGYEVMLTSRYKVYSALLISFNIAYLTRLVSPKFREVLTLNFVIAAAFLYISNQHYHVFDAVQLRKFNITSSFNWRNDATQPTDKSIKHIYKAPATFLDKINFADDTLKSKITCSLKGNTLVLSDPDYQSYDLRDGGLYIVLTNEKYNYVFPTIQKRKHSFRNLLNYNKFFMKGADIALPATELKAGTYRVSWLHYNRQGGLKFEDTPCNTVTIKETQKSVIKTNW